LKISLSPTEDIESVPSPLGGRGLGGGGEIHPHLFKIG